MDYKKYYEARNIVKEILEKDLLGPLTTNEVISDYPIVYYVTGKLYPQKCKLEQEHISAEDAGDTDEEQGISLDNGMVPSSMGLSFSISADVSYINVSAKAALYLPIEDTDSETKHILWERKPVELIDHVIDVERLTKQKRLEFQVDDGLRLQVFLHKVYSDDSKTVTVTLLNTNMQIILQRKLLS